MSVTRSNQSEDSRQKRVDPKRKAYTYLDPDRFVKINLKLNNNGKRNVGRFSNDNKQILVTDYGKYIFLRQGFAEYKNVKKGNKTKRVFTITDTVGLVNWLVVNWESKYSSYIKYYPAEVVRLYMDKEKQNPRSPFISNKYYKRLSQYGHNYGIKLDNITRNQLKSIMDERFYDYFSRTSFDFDLIQYFEDGKWLSHIKTGSNSGYPYNIPQDKEWMYNVIRPRTLKMLLKFIKEGPKAVNWKKLWFSLGSRTERGLAQRVVAMAPAHEKPISGAINEILDENLDGMPISLPRIFGSFDNLAKEFLNADGTYWAKDFEAFDTSILVDLFEMLAWWFYNIGNAFCYLIAFEIFLIIESGIIVAVDLVWLLKSLPSGIGITQFIGSLIHMLIDIITGIFDLAAKKTHQSDDTLSKGDFTKTIVAKSLKEIKDVFHMDVSPIGKKSLLSEEVGLVLQKIIYDGDHIYFAHEARAETNRYLRERKMNTDDDLAQRLGIDMQNKKEKGNLLKIQGCRGLIANIASYGLNAPVLPRVIFITYGRKATSYDEKVMQIALTSLKDYKEEEEHKLPVANEWLRAFYDEAMSTFGWNKVSPRFSLESVVVMLRNQGRVLEF